MRFPPRRGTIRPLAAASAVLLAGGLLAIPATAAANPSTGAPAPTASTTAGPPATVDGNLRTQSFALTGASAQPTAAVGTSARALRAAPAAGDAGWTAQFAVDAGTQSVGFTWTGTATGVLEVRGETPAGWTDWQAMTPDDDDIEPATELQGVDPIWFGQGGVDLVEVKVDQGPLEGLKAMGIKASTPDARSAAAGVQTQAIGQPAIKLRTSWSTTGWKSTNSGCSGGPQLAPALKFAVIHHTVNANTYAESDVPNMLGGIYAFHTGSVDSGGRGWCDIAYNFVVDRFGTIWQGRSGDI
ncbi:MAG TPA: hypothetical protein VGM93_04675, partial [Acidimicrobiales bacterium]